MFPTSEYEHNDFYDAVGPILGLLMSLSLVYPLSMLVRGLVEEREKRLKETMCIMGLQGVLLFILRATLTLRRAHRWFATDVVHVPL